MSLQCMLWTTENDTPTMRDLSRYVIKKYASDWKSIGLELGLDNHLLKNIKSDNPLNCVACLQETLEKWMDLNTEGVTWETLELALTNVNRANLKLDPVDDLFGKIMCLKYAYVYNYIHAYI